MTVRPPSPSIITADDITLVVCLRAHPNNPWVLDRLMWLKGYYEPAPKILIVDFGSTGAYQEAVASACAQNGYTLAYVPDEGVYSAALARNAALSHVETDYIFFCDIDFLCSRDVFSTLARCATAAFSGGAIDPIIDLPAYHLSEDTSSAISKITDPRLRSQALDQVAYASIFERYGDSVEFIAPYSNIFL